MGRGGGEGGGERGCSFHAKQLRHFPVLLPLARAEVQTPDPSGRWPDPRTITTLSTDLLGSLGAAEASRRAGKGGTDSERFCFLKMHVSTLGRSSDHALALHTATLLPVHSSIPHRCLLPASLLLFSSWVLIITGLSPKKLPSKGSFDRVLPEAGAGSQHPSSPGGCNFNSLTSWRP